MSEIFVYRAVDAGGVTLKGELESESRDSVIEALRGRGLLPLEIDMKTQAAEFSLDFLKRVKLEDLSVFTRQLATMINAGLALMRALAVLETQTENAKLKDTITDVRLQIQSGATLSDSLATHPKVFSDLYVAMIRAGETGGFLEEALVRVADQLESQNKLQRQVKGAMVYPVVVLCVAIGVIIGMLTFVIPVFANVFKGFGGKLPAITQFTMGASNIIRHKGWLVVIVVVVVVVGFRKWKKSKGGRPMWDAMRVKAPAKIGTVVQKIGMARWARTLASLTTAGVPMLEAIDVTGSTSGNTLIEKAMTSVRASVQGGGTIATALANEKIFPALITNMVRVGEETGELDTTLSKVADFYEEQVDVAVKSLTSILEPIMICVIGGIVGFMILAMYLPMFDVYNQIH